MKDSFPPFQGWLSQGWVGHKEDVDVTIKSLQFLTIDSKSHDSNKRETLGELEIPIHVYKTLLTNL